MTQCKIYQNYIQNYSSSSKIWRFFKDFLQIPSLLFICRLKISLDSLHRVKLEFAENMLKNLQILLLQLHFLLTFWFEASMWCGFVYMLQRIVYEHVEFSPVILEHLWLFRREWEDHEKWQFERSDHRLPEIEGIPNWIYKIVR